VVLAATTASTPPPSSRSPFHHCALIFPPSLLKPMDSGVELAHTNLSRHPVTSEVLKKKHVSVAYVGPYFVTRDVCEAL
jgi:hypothetical protein